MALMNAFDWLSQSIVADALKTSPTLYILANAAHILSIGILVGAIIPLDLRILGFFRAVPLHVLGPFLSYIAMVGAVMAIGTGTILFTVNASEYVQNPAFLAKIGLLVIGISNALLLRFASAWRVALITGKVTLPIKLSAVLSMTSWLAAILAGRWIGFL